MEKSVNVLCYCRNLSYVVLELCLEWNWNGKKRKRIPKFPIHLTPVACWWAEEGREKKHNLWHSFTLCCMFVALKDKFSVCKSVIVPWQSWLCSAAKSACESMHEIKLFHISNRLWKISQIQIPFTCSLWKRWSDQMGFSILSSMCCDVDARFTFFSSRPLWVSERHAQSRRHNLVMLARSYIWDVWVIIMKKAGESEIKMLWNIHKKNNGTKQY